MANDPIVAAPSDDASPVSTGGKPTPEAVLHEHLKFLQLICKHTSNGVLDYDALITGDVKSKKSAQQKVRRCLTQLGLPSRDQIFGGKGGAGKTSAGAPAKDTAASESDEKPPAKTPKKSPKKAAPKKEPKEPKEPKGKKRKLAKDVDEEDKVHLSSEEQDDAVVGKQEGGVEESQDVKDVEMDEGKDTDEDGSQKGEY
ncbi:hypothetical protein BJ508DRAFT_349735 [Ascobolus immersus RN42]|uniref:Uncharacterized protein n=1 Tax=Ascobolus immersus RN42 TaxID=1160509 RepID=A0A3N4I0F1_ASCIM|nr:hypothetical protein BJ508DRAFT_349735 [Ascobolus immersus RN42]